MKSMTRGKVISRTVQTSDKRFDVGTQRNNIGRLSPGSGSGPPARSEFSVQKLPGYGFELTAM